jgi:hypothetical protein
MKSNGCESRPVKASEQAGSESCHSPGDWWVRSVHSKEAGREDSAPACPEKEKGERLMCSVGVNPTEEKVRTS